MNKKLNLDDLTSFKNYRENVKRRAEQQSISLQKNEYSIKSNNISCNTSISEDIFKSDQKNQNSNHKFMLLKQQIDQIPLRKEQDLPSSRVLLGEENKLDSSFNSTRQSFYSIQNKSTQMEKPLNLLNKFSLSFKSFKQNGNVKEIEFSNTNRTQQSLKQLQEKFNIKDSIFDKETIQSNTIISIPQNQQRNDIMSNTKNLINYFVDISDNQLNQQQEQNIEQFIKLASIIMCRVKNSKFYHKQ